MKFRVMGWFLSMTVLLSFLTGCNPSSGSLKAFTSAVSEATVKALSTPVRAWDVTFKVTLADADDLDGIPYSYRYKDGVLTCNARVAVDDVNDTIYMSWRLNGAVTPMKVWINNEDVWVSADGLLAWFEELYTTEVQDAEWVREIAGYKDTWLQLSALVPDWDTENQEKLLDLINLIKAASNYKTVVSVLNWNVSLIEKYKLIESANSGLTSPAIKVERNRITIKLNDKNRERVNKNLLTFYKKYGAFYETAINKVLSNFTKKYGGSLYAEMQAAETARDITVPSGYDASALGASRWQVPEKANCIIYLNANGTIQSKFKGAFVVYGEGSAEDAAGVVLNTLVTEEKEYTADVTVKPLRVKSLKKPTTFKSVSQEEAEAFMMACIGVAVSESLGNGISMGNSY